ncbi:hypothetical protein SKAU_G00426330 [Synaphobranchus kaupii]|uniref:Uncharacterized protein n=1 Tax=Synaphobranchus kaupii TaxID=118154 RepID=A0A9Q1I9P3_SYNKA|nr:hypothetical protein SKAU_G00426330 [Synaphobranchus kaupii]
MISYCEPITNIALLSTGVTKDVVVKDELEFRVEGQMAGSYNLSGGTMVKASSLHFDQSTVGKSIKELKQEMDVLAENLTAMEKRLKEVYYGKDG